MQSGRGAFFYHGHKRNLLHVKASDAAPTKPGNDRRGIASALRSAAAASKHGVCGIVFPYGFREDPPPSMDRRGGAGGA